MSSIYTWPLITPGLPAPGAIPSTSYLAPGNGIATCNPQFFTEVDLLNLLDRVFPEWYLSPIKDPGPGYELYQAYAAMVSRASLAVGHFECSAFITLSHGGFQATAAVEFYRASTVAGAFTVKEGTIVRTSKTNRSYALTADVVFGAGDYILPGLVRAVAPGAEYNVTGPVFTADGTLLQGEIDTIPLPFLDPIYGEPTLQVRQIADATGGQAAVLDQLGLDRNLPRQPLETDETFKGRIRQLPDTVSIDAIRNQLDALFLTAGFNYDLIETWENRYNSCWNAPDSGTNPIFGDLVELAYNDPRTDRFIPRWMGERDHRAAFVVIVPNFPAFDDRGMAYNDPETVGLASRGTSAYNAPVPDSAGLSGVWNGTDDDSAESRATFLRNAWNMLRQVKGGGVAVTFITAEADQPLP